MAVGVQALFEDWSLEFGMVVHSDSSTSLSIASRRGLGKLRHVQTRYLWLQQMTNEKRITLKKILGTKNSSDLFTKIMAWPLISKYMQTLGYEFRDGASTASKQLKS